MIDWNPKYILLLAFGLLLLGFLLPLLMVMQILTSTFFLNFLAYAASFMGLMLGMFGIMMFITRDRAKRKWEEDNPYAERRENRISEFMRKRREKR